MKWSGLACESSSASTVSAAALASMRSAGRYPLGVPRGVPRGWDPATIAALRIWRTPWRRVVKIS